MPATTRPQARSYLRQTLAILLFSASVAFAQSAPDRPTFEAASVKPVEPGRPGPGPFRGGPGTNSPGQLSGAASFKTLLMQAYDLKDYQITGPAWLDSERYEIIARIPPGAGKSQVSLMLQSLLAERFHLSAHRETRTLPTYTLVVGKTGPKFKESPPAGAPTPAPGDAAPGKRNDPKFVLGPDGFPGIAPGSDLPRSYEIVLGGSDGVLHKLWVRRETMQQLADRLSSQLNRAVVDSTELKGLYDFALAWTMESVGGIPRTYPPPDQIEVHTTPVMSDPSLSIFTAIQSQLGLKLESGKGPLEMLIIDRVERTPTPN